MKHRGPYTITFRFVRHEVRDATWKRKTFRAAENVAATIFRREALSSVQISNAAGPVDSIYNFERAKK